MNLSFLRHFPQAAERGRKLRLQAFLIPFGDCRPGFLDRGAHRGALGAVVVAQLGVLTHAFDGGTNIGHGEAVAPGEWSIVAVTGKTNYFSLFTLPRQAEKVTGYMLEPPKRASEGAAGFP